MTDENKNYPGSADSQGAQVPQPQQFQQGGYTAPMQNQQPYNQQAYQQQMNGLNAAIPTLYQLALDTYK